MLQLSISVFSLVGCLQTHSGPLSRTLKQTFPTRLSAEIAPRNKAGLIANCHFALCLAHESDCHPPTPLNTGAIVPSQPGNVRNKRPDVNVGHVSSSIAAPPTPVCTLARLPWQTVSVLGPLNDPFSTRLTLKTMVVIPQCFPPSWISSALLQ